MIEAIDGDRLVKLFLVCTIHNLINGKKSIMQNLSAQAKCPVFSHANGQHRNQQFKSPVNSLSKIDDFKLDTRFPLLLLDKIGTIFLHN